MLMPDDWVEEASRISQAAVDACKCADGRLLLSCPEEVESRVAAALRSAFDRGAREERERCAELLDRYTIDVKVRGSELTEKFSCEVLAAKIRALPEANP